MIRLDPIANVGGIDIDTLEGFTDNTNAKFGTNLAALEGSAITTIKEEVKTMVIIDIANTRFDINSASLIGGH
jgi:hypothetical protein